jgi:hypothetical protein
MTCDNPVIQALTPEDFKTQFFRDFNYIDTWLVGTTYNTGDQVFYDVNRKFYQCLNDGVVGTLPTVIADWKEISNAGLVSDLDITNAYAEACVSFNDTLFTSDDDMVLGYLYLAAHFLVNDLNAGGVEGGGASGLVASRSVGNVSESYTIPQWQLDSPIYGFYTKSSYGLKYLNMVLPRLAGNFDTVEGCTTP